MRTCPACGEETSAGMSEACTKCGFSPSGEEAEATFEIAGDAPPSDEKPPLINLPDAPPPDQTQAKKSSGVWRGAGIIAAILGFGALRAIPGCGEATGPEPGDVEAEITSRLAQDGVTASVDCPDDSADTEVDARFECEVTLPDGRTTTARVLNREDSYRWSVTPPQQQP